MGQIIQSLKSITFTNKNCLFEAIQKDGRTIDQILKDIEKEKQLELKVIELKSRKEYWGNRRIASHLGIKISKVNHILRFDELGLSYRKINNK